jgi:two-component system, chemotaxis family, chemotaxis protein CheY
MERGGDTTRAMDPSAPIVSAGRPCVLVVDDDVDMLDTFVQVLEINGYAATGAEGGDQALATLRNGLAPALILLDLMMPGMNGWQFREEQLKDPTLARIPVVVVSAAGPGSEAGSLRPAAFLAKPVDLDLLLDTMRRLCR